MSRPQAGMNFYELLEINQSASPVEIKKAYKKLAIQWHPDKNLNDQAAAAEMFKMIGEAYEVLSDPVKRRQYDIELFSPKFPSGYSNQQQNFNFDHDNYSFDRANELFNSMFAEFGMGFSHPFSSFNDQPGFPSMFGQRNFGNGENNHQHRSPFGNFGMMGGFGGFDPFDDSSFGVPSTSGFSSFSSSSTSSFGNRPGGTSRSVSTSTTIGRDGRRVVRKEVTVISPDGSRQTTVEESVDGVPSNHQTITNNNAYSNSSNSISVSTPSYQQPPHEFSNHRSGGQRLARRVSRGYDDDSRNGYSYY